VTATLKTLQPTAINIGLDSKIKEINATRYFARVRNLVSHSKIRQYIEDVSKSGAEENI